MRESLRVLGAIATMAMVGWSGPALADVPPPDACQDVGSVGQMCNNAGPNNDQPGVCVASTCEHPTPDGSSSYACALCEGPDAEAPKDGGGSSSSGSSSGVSSGSGSSSGSSSGSTSSSGSSSSGSGSGKSSCTMSPLARDGATGFGMLALGVGALALARRRRP